MNRIKQLIQPILMENHKEKLRIIPYVPFHEHFPEIAERETRALIVLDDNELPTADYVLTEMYCDEPGCDCRRVFFNILSSKTEKSMAIITFGWETIKYYQRWLGDQDQNTIAAKCVR